MSGSLPDTAKSAPILNSLTNRCCIHSHL